LDLGLYVEYVFGKIIEEKYKLAYSSLIPQNILKAYLHQKPNQLNKNQQKKLNKTILKSPPNQASLTIIQNSE
jgi:hypothetical protein